MYEKELQIILEASQNNALTFFVGAGISALSGAPTWKELIHAISDKLGRVRKKEYSSDEYLQIPQMLYYSLGENKEEYLKDGRLEISNNLAERSIKPFVIDRKNYLFANTPKGATAGAVTFSLIQTAIANNLDPYRYLRFIFTEAPKMAVAGENWVSAMLPDNAPNSCLSGANH